MKTCVLWAVLVLVVGKCLWASVFLEDICNLISTPMFCTCDVFGPNQAHTVSCFIFNTVTPEHSVWNGFSQQQGIRSLTLTSRINHSLTFIPTAPLRMAKNLENFIIHDGHLETLWPYTFVNMSFLQNISLERNDINTLELFAFSFLPNLTKIVLSENYIKKLPAETFYRLPKMRSLYLDRNNLSVIDDMAFVDMPKLEELELNDNYIEGLSSKTFSGLGSLKRLDLCRNKLTKLVNEAFIGTPRLRDLDIHDNVIEEISERAFKGLNHLDSLKLNDNRIKHLPDIVFKGAPNLMALDLTRNRLQTFQKEILQPLVYSRKLQFIVFLKENNLLCNCDTIWLSEHFQKSPNLFFRREVRHLKCKRNNSYFKINKLSWHELGCSEATIVPRNLPFASKGNSSPRLGESQEDPSTTLTISIRKWISGENTSSNTFSPRITTEQNTLQVYGTNASNFELMFNEQNLSGHFEAEARLPSRSSSSSTHSTIIVTIVLLNVLLSAEKFEGTFVGVW